MSADPAETVPPSDGKVSLSEVQERLRIEAAKFDAERGGNHKFNNIRPYQNPNGANWTASFGTRGGAVRLAQSVDVSHMRKVLDQVQAEMPQIRF
jgi:hypothetical protein